MILRVDCSDKCRTATWRSAACHAPAALTPCIGPDASGAPDGGQCLGQLGQSHLFGPIQRNRWWSTLAVGKPIPSAWIDQRCYAGVGEVVEADGSSKMSY